MRLWHRLFIAIAALSVLTLASHVAWQQRSFGEGFADYLDALAWNQARSIAPRLAAEYSAHEGWDFLRRDPQRFGGLAGDGPPGDAKGPPRSPPGADDDGGHGEIARPPPAGSGGPPPMHFASASRLVLFDETGRRIAGSRDPVGDGGGIVVVSAGRQVGTLRIAVLPQLENSAEMEFAQAQLRGAAVAGLGVLLAALLLAFGLARWLLGPIGALTRGTRALASGDFAQRVRVAGNDELAVLGRDFNHLASTLEQHRESRRQWGADIAHELRTPVTILRVELQTLIDAVRPTTPAALASLSAECDRLAHLVEDLYQLSLADAGALEYRFETIDLVELARDAGQAHRATLGAKGLELREETARAPVPVRADGRRLAQLIDNLLVNAQRYTDAPGSVLLRVRRIDDEAVLSVEDSAPGVDAADLPRLFERLFRTDRSRNRAAGGAGLGLAICRAIAEAHAARLDAAPSSLGGLCIRLILPVVDKAT